MSRRNIVVVATALILGTAFAAPALAAGSDVVHYPKAEARSDAPKEQHYDIGIAAPRLRAFVNAPWTDAPSRASF